MTKAKKSYVLYRVAPSQKRKALVHILHLQRPLYSWIICSSNDQAQKLSTYLCSNGIDNAFGIKSNSVTETEAVPSNPSRCHVFSYKDIERISSEKEPEQIIFYNFPHLKWEDEDLSIHHIFFQLNASYFALVEEKDLPQLYAFALAYPIRWVEKNLLQPLETQSQLESQKIQMLCSLLQTPPSVKHQQLASRILMHPQAQWLIAGLLDNMLGREIPLQHIHPNTEKFSQ